MDPVRKLGLSIQGMKTQQGYLRQRVEKLEFLCKLLLLSLCVFYATVIVRFLLRRYG